MRNEDQTLSSDPEKFPRLQEGLAKHCLSMIIQFSTGGRSGAGETRGLMLPLLPDMASLSVGSNNFPTRAYENPPQLVEWLSSEMLKYDIKPEIEAFDLSHILQAKAMADRGQLTGTPYAQFAMGVKNAMPVDRDDFDDYIHTVKRLFGEDALWCAAGIGPNQIVLKEGAVSSGGYARTGLEDNARGGQAALRGSMSLDGCRPIGGAGVAYSPILASRHWHVWAFRECKMCLAEGASEMNPTASYTNGVATVVSPFSTAAAQATRVRHGTCKKPPPETNAMGA